MWIATLRLHQFRNYTETEFQFDPAFNIIVGPNGAGKTNIIEAITILGRGKSFRTAEYRDTIAHQQEHAKIGAALKLPIGELDVSSELTLTKKRFFKSEKPTRAMNTGVATVIFAPEEILIIKGTPSLRRGYIDSFVHSLDPTYPARRYEKIRQQRDQILKQESDLRFISDQLAVWDEQLIQTGIQLFRSRAHWISRLNQFLPTAYAEISANQEEGEWRYDPFCQERERGTDLEIAEWMRHQLATSRREELLRKRTLVGPHTDDIIAMIDKRGVKQFGSQGEHRSFILAAKIAEINVTESVIGARPILLLDDVASEIDENRNTAFFTYLTQYTGQVFITATHRTLIHLDRPMHLTSL